MFVINWLRGPQAKEESYNIIHARLSLQMNKIVGILLVYGFSNQIKDIFPLININGTLLYIPFNLTPVIFIPKNIQTNGLFLRQFSPGIELNEHSTMQVMQMSEQDNMFRDTAAMTGELLRVHGVTDGVANDFLFKNFDPVTPNLALKNQQLGPLIKIKQ